MSEGFSYKKYFIDFGIFVGIIGISIFILFYSVKLSRKSWQKNLKVTIEKFLDESEANTWTVGNFIQINNSFSLTAACYEAQNRKTGEICKVILIRTESIYGPLPSVFLVHNDEKVDFLGYSSLHGRVGKQSTNKPSNKKIDYWKMKILEIL